MCNNDSDRRMIEFQRFKIKEGMCLTLTWQSIRTGKSLTQLLTETGL